MWLCDLLWPMKQKCCVPLQGGNFKSQDALHHMLLGYASCFLEAQSWSLPLPVGGWDCRVQPTRLNKQREQEKKCVVLYPLLHVSVYLFFSYCSNCGFTGFPGGSDGKESACSVGDPGLIPESGRSPEEGNGFPLQNSCLENSMDRGAWQGYAKSQIWLSN